MPYRFLDVIEQTAYARGLDPDAGQITPADAEAAARYATTAAKIIWEYFPWPQICEIHDAWPIAVVAADGSYCILEPAVYMGAILGIFTSRPTVGKEMPPKLAYITRQGNGVVEIEGDQSPTVALYYRKSRPVFTSRAPVNGRMYAIGNVIYDSTTGNCWTCENLLVGGTPWPSVGDWTVVTIPDFAFEPICQAVVAAFSAEDGQNSTASLIESSIEGYLEHELNQLRQTGQIGPDGLSKIV